MKRRHSIFDSESELRVFHTLASTWSAGYRVADHVPVQNVLGWEQIGMLGLSSSDTQYLRAANFDFVVCTKDQGEPLIAIEFDGLSRGYSKDGEYHSRLATDERTQKFNLKLAACAHYGMPMVVISYNESSANPSGVMNTLDAIVGSVIAGNETEKEITSRLDELGDVLSNDPKGDAAGELIEEVRLGCDLRHNPVIRKTAELRKAINYDTDGIRFLHDRDHLGYVGGRFAIISGFKTSAGRRVVREHYREDIYIRSVNCDGCDDTNLLIAIGNYLLLLNATNKFGLGAEFWVNAEKEARWVER